LESDRAGDVSGVLFSFQTIAPTIPSSAMQGFARFAEAAAERFPHLTMLMREHPAHPLSSLGLKVSSAPNVLDASPDRMGLVSALNQSLAVVSISSTTLLEGILGLRPALILDELPYSPDVAGWNAGLQVRGGEEALDALARLADPNFRNAMHAGMNAFRERYFGGPPGGAATRTAGLLMELV
jgi:hypothetical protein